MNRVELLLATPSVRISLFDHPPGEAHVDPAEEAASRDAIAFVETGTFEVRPAGRGRGDAPRWRFAAGMLLVTTRALPFTCRHDDECPSDRCLSVAFAPEAVEELRGAGLPALHAGALHAGARQRFLWHRLRGAGARAAAGDPLRGELLAGALYESVAGAPAAPVRGATTPDVLRRVARAAELADAEYARRLTLDELASAAGMSAFHFARTFARLHGMPPHRYLTAVRLRAAASRLAAGERVTATCYAVGFESLSHFVTTFRRRFGVTPSAFARAPQRTALRAALAAPVWRRRAAG